MEENMFINEILPPRCVGNGDDIAIDALRPLVANCHQFLEESKDLPLLKNLSVEYKDVQKVKVRQQKRTTAFSETFNQAFKREHTNIVQRAIFANGESSFIKPLLDSSSAAQEPFYIFPPNGYKFMYCKEVKNSTSEYRQVFDALFEQFGNEKEQATTIITDLLKFTYTKENLHEGISLGSEIIIYGVPYYFAVRASVVNTYNELLTSLHNH